MSNPITDYLPAEWIDRIGDLVKDGTLLQHEARTIQAMRLLELHEQGSRIDFWMMQLQVARAFYPGVEFVRFEEAGDGL